MSWLQRLKITATVIIVLTATGCASTKAPFDYSAFKESNPHSILVLPPVNNSPEVQASYSVLSYATRPLSEAGFYVMPVTLVDEAFKENGISQPSDMHATSPEKLRLIFGADSALYITVSKYGQVYAVLSSASVVTADAKLIDLKTGKQLWNGNASASSEEGKNQQGGLAGMLISALVNQVIGTVFDQSHVTAGITTTRLLSAGIPNGMLFGPRSPNYVKN
ncbi:DUF799 domain-containing protein [Rhodoferax antarcticus]|uniref:DUF799 domain-containing protein n=1 Tax=Rhodoferax antarcticus TaxID=81479 RepID=UPI00094F98D7|nr:DUF799 domain-containing protein [Rhodoferax antarcticus]APW46672.1 hypothetical protein RA876_10170 [Rhodoferax antarcticus]MCW2312970.1 hypothetical protein [Rhodoferax antarcticus]